MWLLGTVGSIVKHHKVDLDPLNLENYCADQTELLYVNKSYLCGSSYFFSCRSVKKKQMNVNEFLKIFSYIFRIYSYIFFLFESFKKMPSLNL